MGVLMSVAMTAPDNLLDLFVDCARSLERISDRAATWVDCNSCNFSETRRDITGTGALRLNACDNFSDCVSVMLCSRCNLSTAGFQTS